MTPIGETLRRERLKKKLDLNQVSNELKIAPRFLEAIEQEQFDKLPGAVFAKAFVRQYARALGLEEEELAGQVKQLLDPPVPEPQFAHAIHENGSAPIHVPPLEEWESAEGSHEFKWPSWIPATGLFIVALLGSSFAYAWWQRDRHTVNAQNTPPVTHSAVVPTPALPGQNPVAAPLAAASPSDASATATVTPAPATEKPAEIAAEKPAEPVPPKAEPTSKEDAAPETPVAAAAGPTTVHVEITADDDVWVSARSDGKYLYSRTLGANQSSKLDGSESVTVRLGNAGGVRIKLNGKPVGPVGEKGQARTIQFTSGGFQIVAAPKPSLPPI